MAGLLSAPPADLATRPPWWSKYQVDLPDGERGRWTLDHFTIDRQDIYTLREAMNGRYVPNGTYTRLCRGNVLVMSDTLAEIGDHLGILQRLDSAPAGSSVLIHGLGLGMTLRCALANPSIERIDVVEIDPDVVGLVGPHYSDARLTIHLDDALARRWPRGASWTYVWHDVWDTICTDHLPEMATLHRRFARRCTWQGSWGRRQAMADRARNRGRW